MAQKAQAITAFFLCLNLIFFSMVSAQTCSIDYKKITKLNVCSLIGGLLDLDAALCLCAAINANLLGIILDVDLALGTFLSLCGKTRPDGYVCKKA